MPKIVVLAAAAAAALPLLVGCGRVQDEAAGGPRELPLRLVATTGMVADAAARVGGDRVRVEALMGPGIDPHLYKASEGDVEALVGADLVLFNGLHLEAKLGDVLERLDARAAAITDSIPRSRLLSPPQFQGQYDPHVWFDVDLWALAVEQTGRILAEHDPAGAATYRRNAARYAAELRRLHTWVTAQARRVPAERRVLVTAHDAFGYFGRRYGFEVRGLQGISTATEAGAQDVQELAEFIADRQIPSLFVESSVSPRAIDAVRAAVRSRGFDVEVGEQLYSDAMGEPGTPEGTYPGMVRHNVRAIVDGLS
ncbi:MAG TPA: zinc ABC transporter substrate-binding protein [Gaiellaceae bacterium]|nr:zinc ABC transporter substrate-binding protein [Gaiellaceae bacterium]